MPALDEASIEQIYELALRHTLYKQRSVLLTGVDPRFEAGLEISQFPIPQLNLDLHALNSTSRKVGDDIPLRGWLKKAARILIAEPDAAACLLGYAARVVEHADPSPAETTLAAKETVATLKEISAESGEVRSALNEARESLSEIAVRLTRLVTRKRLHDVLHRLQIEGLPLIQASIQRARFEDATQRRMVGDHLSMIDSAYREASGEIENLDQNGKDYKNEARWVEQLSAISESAQGAVEAARYEDARSAVVDLRRLIRNAMSRLNVSLSFDLNELDITKLAEHLRTFATLYNKPGDVRAIQLRDSATRLLLLEVEIERLVGTHDRWQRLDDDLWSAEDDLIMREETLNNLQSFSRLWPNISCTVEDLAGIPAAAWYPKAAGWAAAFQQKCPMPATPPLQSDARDDFRYFMKVTRNQFRAIDLELKARCNRLAALTRPLQDLAR